MFSKKKTQYTFFQVNIVPYSSGDHDRGSSRLKLKDLVNFGWSHTYHPGQMVTTHGHLLAYAIVKPAKHEGVVRVTHRRTGARTLLSGMSGKVKDLAFARTANEVTFIYCKFSCGI